MPACGDARCRSGEARSRSGEQGRDLRAGLSKRSGVAPGSRQGDGTFVGAQCQGREILGVLDGDPFGMEPRDDETPPATEHLRAGFPQRLVAVGGLDGHIGDRAAVGKPRGLEPFGRGTEHAASGLGGCG